MGNLVDHNGWGSTGVWVGEARWPKWQGFYRCLAGMLVHRKDAGVPPSPGWGTSLTTMAGDPPGSGWGSSLTEMAGGSTVAWVGNLVDHNGWGSTGVWVGKLGGRNSRGSTGAWLGCWFTEKTLGFHRRLGGEPR